IRRRVRDVATPVTLDKEEQLRRIAVLGLALLAATAAASKSVKAGERPRKAEAAGKPAASILRRRVVAVSPERESCRSSRALVLPGPPLSGGLWEPAPSAV